MRKLKKFKDVLLLESRMKTKVGIILIKRSLNKD